MEKVRLDKWLWAARFFRTRSKAKEAIEGGKVHIDGARGKPSREIVVGETLTIRQGYDEKVVVVQALSDTRGGASDAALLYDETADSVQRREAAAAQRKLAGTLVRPEGRPSKRDRRRINEFRQKNPG